MGKKILIIVLVIILIIVCYLSYRLITKISSGKEENMPANISTNSMENLSNEEVRRFDFETKNCYIK